MSKVNVKEHVENSNGQEILFKKNVDFFELKEGTFYTIDALAKKYDTATNTLYKKAKDFDIPMEKIAGFTCFKDDIRFEKQKRTINGNAENMRSLIAYPQLHDKVIECIDSINTFKNEVALSQVRSSNDWRKTNEIIVRQEEKLNEVNIKLDLILEELGKYHYLDRNRYKTVSEVLGRDAIMKNNIEIIDAERPE